MLLPCNTVKGLHAVSYPPIRFLPFEGFSSPLKGNQYFFP